MKNTIKLTSITAKFAICYEKTSLCVTAQRQGRHLEITVTDFDNHIPEAELPYLAMIGRTRAGVIHFTYWPGVRVTQSADIVNESSILEGLADDEQFAQWFTINVLPLINNTTK